MRELPLIDQLILDGWKIQPNSVLINSSEILLLEHPLPDVFWKTKSSPPFEHCVIYAAISYHASWEKPSIAAKKNSAVAMLAEDPNGNVLVNDHLFWTVDSKADGDKTKSFIQFVKSDGYKNSWVSPFIISCVWEGGYTQYDNMEIFDITDDYKNGDIIPPPGAYIYNEQEIIDQWGGIGEHAFGQLSMVLQTFIYMHQKRDVEFIDYPKQQRRRMRRLKGKEPSPYFMLKVTNKTIKRHGSDHETPLSSGQKRDLPIHIVRGHFMTHPDDHPIPQFAGKTFWVTDHVRGDKAHGEIKKGYTIRLD